MDRKSLYWAIRIRKIQLNVNRFKIRRTTSLKTGNYE